MSPHGSFPSLLCRDLRRGRSGRMANHHPVLQHLALFGSKGPERSRSVLPAPSGKQRQRRASVIFLKAENRERITFCTYAFK